VPTVSAPHSGSLESKRKNSLPSELFGALGPILELTERSVHISGFSLLSEEGHRTTKETGGGGRVVGKGMELPEVDFHKHSLLDEKSEG